ncbi:MAG: gamma-glutamyltransferase family protein [Ktedonobacterales bacterium]
MQQHRPVTLATHGVVAAPHYLAAEAGVGMMRAGGNAVDAAIAANAVLQVVYPQLNGLGGDLFALLWDARSARLYGLNASGRAPGAATIERYVALGYETMPPFGIHSVTVPGCPDGWRLLSERFGRVELGHALAPAIGYAADGFPVGPGLHAALLRMDQMPYTHGSFRAHFMAGGEIPVAGSVMRRPEFATTLRRLAEHGAGDFYHGGLAARIAAFFAREGGLLTADDLAGHSSEWVEPLAVRFADLDVYELPPNTQGIAALQMLGIAGGLPLGPSPLSAATVHLAVEAKKLAFADRDAYLTDLAHMRVAPEMLIAPDYLARRRALISAERAQSLAARVGLRGDTVYLCAADGDGNAVSLIQSNYRGFGSGVVVEGTGIALQNRGAYFSLDPAHTNALAPGKRTLHTLIPSLALRDGQPAVVFGAMGGDGQPQTHLQFYTALARYGMNVQAAIEMPRWLDGVAAIDTPERLWMEARFPVETMEALRGLGHAVEPLARWDAQVGHANGIVIDRERGGLAGGSDPRAEGAAAGW